MKTIKLASLHLENFKCHASLSLDFGGGNASIYGDNATGKTSVYDALTWLLFGKDSHGNGENTINIKPLDADGNVADHQAITGVEAGFLVDGEPLTLKRSFREVWSTRRGSMEAVYTGNVSDYAVNAVPVKKNAFAEAVKGLVDENVFRMLTNVSYFPEQMRWQDRRNILFEMAGTLTDREIMAKDPRFQPLADSLGKYSLDDYRKVLTAQRKGLTGTRDEAPTRISECQKSLDALNGIDFGSLRQQEQQQEIILSELEAAMAQIGTTGVESKRLELREAKLARDTIVSQNLAYRASQKPTDGGLAAMKASLRSCAETIRSQESQIKRFQAHIEQAEAMVAESRSSWISINSESFTGGKCPTCGQDLPFDQLMEATNRFDADKRRRLDQVVEIGNRWKDDAAHDSDMIKQIQADMAETKKRMDELSQAVAAAEKDESAHVIHDMDGYEESCREAEDRVNTIQNELSAITATVSQQKASIESQMQDVKAQLHTIRVELAKEGMLSTLADRIAQIKAEAKAANEAMEHIEKMLFLIEEFTRFKATFVEAGINDLFDLAKFRMFKDQANGGLEERCDVTYDGVPYTGLNNGMRINVGVDIINALSIHYGVSVPLFVDNAESVTRLKAGKTQVIRLVVSEEDKELRIHED